MSDFRGNIKILKLIFYSCEKETSQPIKSKKIIKNNNTINKLNKWNINSVCDCYTKGIKNLTNAYKIRNKYSNFVEYKKNKEDVKKVKSNIKDFRSIQAYCLQSYKRAMFDNNCDSEEILKNKQKKLFELGIQISKY